MLLDQGLALHAHIDVSLHHGCRVCHAEINEMFDACIYCGLNSCSSCDQVDTAELCRLSGAGMRHADEVYERVCRGDFFDIGALIEGVSRYQRAASRYLGFRSTAHQSFHSMSARQ